MTNGQRKVLIAGAVAMCAACTVLPWRSEVITLEEATRRAVATTAPRSQPDYSRAVTSYTWQQMDESGRISLAFIGSSPSRATVAFDVLAAELLAVLLVTGILFLIAKPNTPPRAA